MMFQILKLDLILTIMLFQLFMAIKLK